MSPPPPPPPVTPVATTLSIQGGDGQSADAGSAVAVAPSAMVRDQSSRPMAGVSVAFSVDSGGGVVTTANATTGTDGVASSGGWTLGFGRNRLRAASGSLPPVFFTANAAGELTVLEGTFGTGGGSLTVSRPGDPLNGMKLELPASAFGRSIQVKLRRVDSNGAPSKAGMRLASPVFTITSDAPGYTQKGAFVVRIPVQVPLSEWPVVVAFDPTTGSLEALPGARTATGVVAITRHLNSAYLVPSRGASRGRAAGRALAVDPGISMAVYGLPITTLAGDFDSGYRPNVDNWEFDFWASAQNWISGLYDGPTLASAWYYSQYKGQYGSLNGRYQAAKGVEGSNWRGIRLASVASARIKAYDLASYNFWQAVFAASTVSGDSLKLLNVKAGIHVTGRPQVISAVNSGATNLASETISMLAYRTSGSSLNVTVGTNATGLNAPRTLTLALGSFNHVFWHIKNGYTGTVVGPYEYDTFWALGETAGIPMYEMDAMFAAFFGGTIGDNEFPTVELESQEERAIGDTLFVADDSTRAWVECTAMCQWGHAPGPAIQPVDHVAEGKIYLESGGNWSGGTGFVRGNGTLTTDADDGKRIGLVVTIPGNATLTAPLYVTWKEFVIKTRRLTISPKPLNGNTNTNYNLSAAYNRPLPANPRWEWDLGDGQKITTAMNSATIKYPSSTKAVDTFDIKVTLKSGASIEATGHTSAVIRSIVTQITPRNALFLKDSLARFAALNQRTHPVNARYKWTFVEGGITDSVKATGDTTASYTFRRIGTYAVVVQVTDSAGSVIGRDSTSAIVRGERWAFTTFIRGALTSTLPAGVTKPISFWEDSMSLTDNTLRDSLRARPGGGTLELYRGTRPLAWRHPLEITAPNSGARVLHIIPAVGADAMYVTFPRGSQLMASPFAATGNAILGPSLGLPIYSPPAFANSLVRTPLVRYVGRAATQAYPMQFNILPQSPVETYLEIDATATPTGVSGTITFVTRPVCGGMPFNQCPGGLTAANGEVRRVFSFTAVPK